MCADDTDTQVTGKIKIKILHEDYRKDESDMNVFTTSTLGVCSNARKARGAVRTGAPPQIRGGA